VWQGAEADEERAVEMPDGSSPNAGYLPLPVTSLKSRAGPSCETPLIVSSLPDSVKKHTQSPLEKSPAASIQGIRKIGCHSDFSRAKARGDVRAVHIVTRFARPTPGL